MTSLVPVLPGQIDLIKAHLAAGNQVAVVTHTKTIKLTAKSADYIRASSDGKGYRLGWPGRTSVYAFSTNVFLIPEGMKI